MGDEDRMRTFRRDRRRDRLFVALPAAAALALAATVMYRALSSPDTSGAALGSPVTGSSSDSTFWLAAAVALAAGTTVANWRLPNQRLVISIVAGIAVIAAVVIAVAI